MHPLNENPGWARRTSAAVRLTALALIASSALLGGCASYSRDHVIVGSVPDDYRTRHPIVVHSDERTEDLIVTANASTLSYRDRSLVSNFGAQFRKSGSAKMAILVPIGAANENAAKRISAQAKSVLTHEGVSPARISVQYYDASSHGDAATVRLVYLGVTAEVAGKCGAWNEDILETQENRNYANFGCATQKNLAAMVANPEDLVGPRAPSEIDAPRRTNVIDDWRDAGSGDLEKLF